MIEIKFRAWIKEDSVMIYSDSQHEVGEYMEIWQLGSNLHVEIQEIYFSSPGGNDPCECVRYIKPDQNVMQYTGLKDKNGKEIYEGDILRVETGKLMVLGWSEKFASFILKREDWAFSHWFGESCDPASCEVIGNIHQNSELLS